MRRFGLVGKSLQHSFSKQYFSDKFQAKQLLDCIYDNFEFASVDEILPKLHSIEDLVGFNVTFPYKEGILSKLDKVAEEARSIGAVNCVKRINGQYVGFNTDVYGFSQSIKPFLDNTHERALILGTGGASKAAAYVLKTLGVDVFFVSRDKSRSGADFNYDELSPVLMKSFLLIINCTPCGTFPNLEELPSLPMNGFTTQHLLYDMVYNPAQTALMKAAANGGATTINGWSMLQLQAEKSWEIWNTVFD